LEDRPAGRDLIRDARLKKFDQLLVYKLDRLGRDAFVILQAVAAFSACGVQTHTARYCTACERDARGRIRRNPRSTPSIRDNSPLPRDWGARRPLPRLRGRSHCAVEEWRRR
jgi:hypothetical protein